MMSWDMEVQVNKLFPQVASDYVFHHSDSLTKTSIWMESPFLNDPLLGTTS